MANVNQAIQPAISWRDFNMWYDGFSRQWENTPDAGPTSYQLRQVRETLARVTSFDANQMVTNLQNRTSTLNDVGIAQGSVGYSAREKF